MFRVDADFNTETQRDEIVIREMKHINVRNWKQRECAPYQLPDGTLVPVYWKYPEYIEVTIND